MINYVKPEQPCKINYVHPARSSKPAQSNVIRLQKGQSVILRASGAVLPDSDLLMQTCLDLAQSKLLLEQNSLSKVRA